MATIKKSDMYRPDINLVDMQKEIDNKELFVFIDYITPSNVTRSIKHNFLRLLKLDEENYEILPGNNGAYLSFFMADGVIFRDIDGNIVYETEADGITIINHDVVTGQDEEGNDITESQPKPLIDGYTKNFDKYGPVLVPDTMKTISKYLGDHPQP